jgi:D-alanine-D-alanine ligase
LRICLLTNQDLDADPFPTDDWPCDPRAFLPEATWTLAVVTKGNAVATVEAQVAAGHDVFFNLCDGAAGEKKPGIEVVETLERLGAPFTGATSDCYEPSRERMKAICRERGVATPAHVLARTEEDVARAAATLRFPLFVKHHNSYASVDITRASRVATPAGLARQASKFIRRHGAALVEEYVDGIECTVLVAEDPDDPARPIAYPPMQYRFPAGEHFKHERLKWVDYGAMTCVPVEDRALAARLREAATALFLGLGGVSFARCDVRVDGTGRPFRLEINPNCGIYYPPTDPGSADLCLLHDPAGHAGFTRRLVAAAIARHARRGRLRRIS